MQPTRLPAMPVIPHILPPGSGRSGGVPTTGPGVMPGPWSGSSLLNAVLHGAGRAPVPAGFGPGRLRVRPLDRAAHLGQPLTLFAGDRLRVYGWAVVVGADQPVLPLPDEHPGRPDGILCRHGGLTGVQNATVGGHHHDVVADAFDVERRPDHPSVLHRTAVGGCEVGADRFAT